MRIEFAIGTDYAGLRGSQLPAAVNNRAGSAQRATFMGGGANDVNAQFRRGVGAASRQSRVYAAPKC